MIVCHRSAVFALACLFPLLAHAQSQGAGTVGGQSPDGRPSFEDQVVVSASRAEQELVNAPATVSIIRTETIQNSPATNMGDLLRTVPGVNVTQVSTRDINLTTRGATSTLATSQLALVDGRSIYLDFFGMILWDLVPATAADIRQVEVIRGPASAVWGANAMNGVVNIITRTPRELAAAGGTTLTIGAGAFNRDVKDRKQDSGALFYVNGSHARAVNSRWAYRVSAGYLTQDPLARPVGTLPNAFATPYPPFQNQGTSQPKFDARADYDFDNGGTLVLSGGVAGTDGIVHGGIGPFDISDATTLSYLSARYQNGGRRIAFFTNLLDGEASNLLTVGPTGAPIGMEFNTRTFDIEATDVRLIGTRHALTFGGNFRHNAFDLSLAPGARDRNEGGAFLQDEVFLSDRFRWVVGGRVDKFSSIENAVFSPRTTFMFKPDAAQTIRVSYNRAFRAPSLVNNEIDATVMNQVNLSALSPALAQFSFPIHASGNRDLEPETLTAYEVGYTGILRNRATLTAAIYWNHTKNGIYFTPVAAYSPSNPPPGWPLPPALIGVLATLPTPVVMPSEIAYLNLGRIKDKGIELGVDTALTANLNVFTNYSWQDMPEIEDFPAGTGINDINWPARHRFNAGFDFSYRRWLGNMAVHHSSSAYWQDVLDARFAGSTEPYTTLNAGFGVRWLDGRLVTSVKGTNLGNQEVMQHIFGDVIKRQIVGEARFSF